MGYYVTKNISIVCCFVINVERVLFIFARKRRKNRLIDFQYYVEEDYIILSL